MWHRARSRDAELATIAVAMMIVLRLRDSSDQQRAAVTSEPFMRTDDMWPVDGR